MTKLASAHRHLTNQNETASSGQVLLALYDGCLGFCRSAKLSIQANDPDRRSDVIAKATSILGELRSTLDHEEAPEICQSLDKLYVFFQDQLSMADTNVDSKQIDPVISILSELRDAWAETAGKSDDRIIKTDLTQ